jgi:hypothetical protein
MVKILLLYFPKPVTAGVPSLSDINVNNKVIYGLWTPKSLLISVYFAVCILFM